MYVFVTDGDAGPEFTSSFAGSVLGEVETQVSGL